MSNLIYDPTRSTTAKEISEILNQEQLDKWVEVQRAKKTFFRSEAPFDLKGIGPLTFPVFIKSYATNKGTNEWRHCIFEWNHQELKYVYKGDAWR